MGRPDQIESVLLDASSLIGVIKGEKEFECLKPLLAAIDRGQIRLVESTAILAEVVPAHGQDGSAHAVARETVRALLEAPATDLVDVSVAVARKAGQIRAELGMKTWDSIHLATAIIAKADVLIVRDRKFPFGDYEGVWITEPFDIDEDKLFSA